jgi:hypothetical protein
VQSIAVLYRQWYLAEVLENATTCAPSPVEQCCISAVATAAAASFSHVRHVRVAQFLGVVTS